MNRTQHPVEVHGMEEILDEGIEVRELSVKDLLIEILNELKKMNLRFEEVFEIEVDEEDIENDY